MPPGCTRRLPATVAIQEQNNAVYYLNRYLLEMKILSCTTVQSRIMSNVSALCTYVAAHVSSAVTALLAFVWKQLELLKLKDNQPTHVCFNHCYMYTPSHLCTAPSTSNALSHLCTTPSTCHTPSHLCTTHRGQSAD